MKSASRSRWLKAIVIFLCPGFWVRLAAGETPSLSIAQALSTARERNPAVDISRERVNAAEGMHTQAGLLPNPMLTATSENQPFSAVPGFSFANQTDDYIYGTQLIELGGKRSRRMAAAQAGAAIASEEAEITSRQLAVRVANDYWIADSGAMVRDLYRGEAAMFGQMIEYSQARVREGAAAGADLLRIQIESDRLRTTANFAAAEANRSLIALYREMGAGDFPQDVTFTDPIEHLERVDAPAIDVILRQRPEMRAAEDGLKQAQANLSLERANAIPDPDLMFGYKRWSGFNQFTGLNTMFFGVKTPIPIFNRNQGKITAADAEFRIAKRNLAAEEIAIRAEVASANREYLSSREALDQIMAGMTDRANRNLEITSQAYRIGGTDLIRYIDAERIRIETRVTYLRAIARYHQSVVNLEYASGITR